MSLIQTVKNTAAYKGLKKEKDDYLTRRMVKKNKKNEYLRRIKLYKETLDFKYDIFDYKKIIEERPDCDFEYTAYNGFYGLSYVMKRYTGYKGLLYPIFIHNSTIDMPHMGEFGVCPNEIGLVCSERLAEIIEKNTDKTVLAIGPTIMYAKSVLTEEETVKIKKKLGKTLLILPSHSIEDYSCKSNVDNFLEYAEYIKSKFHFNTVLVCLYFYDIVIGEDEYYTSKGYQVVSTGHRNSRDFLDMQRTLYEICDGVISQGYTTGLSYGFCMGKPISIFNDDITYYKTGKPDEKQIPMNSLENQKFNNLFAEYEDTLTDEQKDYAEFLWNVSKKRSREELLKILKLAKKIDKTCNKAKKARLVEEIKKFK